jgi:Spx/MgsR family transcriptional regulator
MSVVMYGIKNCDTIKKARKWLEGQAIEYRFHDYRSDGLTTEQLELFEKKLGWEALLNKRGTTWRKQPDSIKGNINRSVALELMLKQPAMIKRPLLENGTALILGFSEKQYQQELSA